MKRIRYATNLIPNSASEAMVGAFAVALNDSLVAILHSNGTAHIISLFDYCDSANLPNKTTPKLTINSRVESSKCYLNTRFQIAQHLNTAQVPQGVLKLRTALPLNGSGKTAKPTEMYRYTAGIVDLCFDAKRSQLRNGTYLVPDADRQFVSTGYGAVGRYSLPCPYPAGYVHKYLLPLGTTFKVGTVEPQFQQSGGGVEICIDNPTSVSYLGTNPMSDY